MTNQSKALTDLMRLMEPFKVPGTDVSAMVGCGRKDMEALLEANKAAYQEPQALTAELTKMPTHAIQKIQDDTKQAK